MATQTANRVANNVNHGSGTRFKRNPDRVKVNNSDWYKVWEETEHSRRGTHNEMEHQLDRMHSATRDFVRRPWPSGPYTGSVRSQFDQIQLFIGTLINLPIWKKVTKGSKDSTDDSGDKEDDDDDHDDYPSYKKPHHPVRPRIPYWTEPVQVETDEEIQELLAQAGVEKDDKLIDFLNDPARGVQVYLSSYMMRQGFHFSEQNLFIIPRLWRFYINYLLRNHVIPEPEREEGLHNALRYVELAAEELPKTSVINKAIPDGLCKALDECLGIQSQMFELNLKAQVRFENESEKQNPHDYPASSDDGLSDSNWDGEVYSPDTSPDVESDNLLWSTGDPDTLMKYLGPTLFPLTHTSGVIEESIRRIKSITAPQPPLPSSHFRDAEPDGDAQAIEVELELNRRFTKVLLSPWIGHEKSDEGKVSVYQPRIPKLSRGKVIVKKRSVVFDGMNDDDAVMVGTELSDQLQPSDALGLKPHDPLKDDITIFLEPDTAEKLKVGMGIGGLWVQIVRRSDLPDLEFMESRGSGNEQSEMKASLPSMERYWFVDSVFTALTSYHAV